MAAEEGVAGLLNAIPSAAASPLALVAYLAALAAWVAIGYNTNRLRILMRYISKLPESDRKSVIYATIGFVPIPDGITGEQYLRRRIHTYIFAGFIAICVVTVIIIGMSFYKYYERRVVADNLINNIFSQPSSDFMTAVNAINDGTTTVTNAAQEIGPKMSLADIQDATNALLLQHLNKAQIEKRLAEAAGTAPLRDVNKKLLKAAEFLDNTFSDLATCFRELNCAAGNQFSVLCRSVVSLNANIDRINQTAQAIPQVNFNASNSAAVLSDGSLDVYFAHVFSKSVQYLASLCS